MIQEFYEAHIEYQYAKIELINIYMELYEHVSSPSKSKEIVQIITDIIHSRPVLDFEVDCFHLERLL